MSFYFDWDLNYNNQPYFEIRGNKIEYKGYDKTMTAVSKTVFREQKIYEFDVTYYVVRDGYFTFGVAKYDYSKWTSYCHKDEGIGMIGTYMGGGVRQVITLRAKLDVPNKSLHLFRRLNNRTESVDYDFTHLFGYNGVRLAVSFSDYGDFMELSNFTVSDPIKPYSSGSLSPIIFQWETNFQNGTNFALESNNTNARYVANDQTMTCVSQNIFYDNVYEFNVSYFCAKGTHFTLGVVASNFSDWRSYCHQGKGIGMIGTYFGGGDRQRIELLVKIDMIRKELTITRKSNFLGDTYNFAHLSSLGVRLACSLTYRDDSVMVERYITPTSGIVPVYFSRLGYFEWETNFINQNFFRIAGKRIDYIGRDKTMTITSRTVLTTDVEFDVSYYCTREGFFTFGVARPSYSNYTSYCHLDQGIGMIGKYMGGGERQRVDLKVQVSTTKRELTITKKSNNLQVVYDFKHLYENGIKLAVSFSDIGDFLEII